MYLNPSSSIRIVSRKKLGGLADHWGIELPNGNVAHCAPGVGVQVTAAEQFAMGHDVITIRDVPVHMHGEVLQRLQLALSERRAYHAIDWNCEVFANWLTGEKPESAQAKGWAIAALALIAVGVVARFG